VVTANSEESSESHFEDRHRLLDLSNSTVSHLKNDAGGSMKRLAGNYRSNLIGYKPAVSIGWLQPLIK
jgi:hypothetical protein